MLPCQSMDTSSPLRLTSKEATITYLLWATKKRKMHIYTCTPQSLFYLFEESLWTACASDRRSFYLNWVPPILCTCIKNGGSFMLRSLIIQYIYFDKNIMLGPKLLLQSSWNASSNILLSKNSFNMQNCTLLVREIL